MLLERLAPSWGRPGLTARAEQDSLSEAKAWLPVSIGAAVVFSPGREPPATPRGCQSLQQHYPCSAAAIA